MGERLSVNAGRYSGPIFKEIYHKPKKKSRILRETQSGMSGDVDYVSRYLGLIDASSANRFYESPPVWIVGIMPKFLVVMADS